MKEIKNPTPSKWLFQEELVWLGPQAEKRAAGLLAGWDRMPEKMDTAPSLQLTVSLNTDSLTPGQPLHIRAKLANQSSTDVFVNTGQPTIGFQCRIFDSQGKFYWGPVSRIEGRFGPVHKEHFTKIEAKQSVTLPFHVKTIRDVGEPESHIWTSVFPGRFLLTLTYSHDGEYPTKDLPTAWTGQLVSNSIEFQVSEK
ncbi:MAG: hypothetical protein AB1696_23485 [Planctomycetota bacterium]